MDKETPATRALITDLDNTLYNWIDFMGPSIRAMMEVIVDLSRLSEEEVAESFQKVYSRHRDLEYAFAIQELDICRTAFRRLSPKDLQELVIAPAKRAFTQARHKHLRLYPHVKETIEWAYHEGIIIIGSTDSTLFHAGKRLESLQIDQFFKALISRQDFRIHPHAAPYIIRKQRKGEYTSRIPFTKTVDISELKPNSAGFDMIVRELGLNRELTYMIGDSLWKDIRFAQLVGITDIWARYGKEAHKENLETLRRITYWTEEDIIKNEEAKREVKPTFIVDDFSQIKSIIASCQMTLF